MHRALAIAGSDCSGGAGIQADLKTFMAYGVYGMSAVTAVVAENTVGVQAIHELPVPLIVQQIRSCADDIGVDAVKIGMLSTAATVAAVAEAIGGGALPNVVVDPVMVAKSGDSLLSEAARRSLLEILLPLARIVTPNRFEAEALTGQRISTLAQMRESAARLREAGCEWVVLKGGHMPALGAAVDIAFDGQEYHELRAPLFDTRHTHGTGCTFSSAIAAGLAKGLPPLAAIQRAKQFITEAIRSAPGLGHGHGPTNHLAGVSTRW